MLECLGDEPCHFILIFDNGYFSEFGTFSISDWIGHTPKPLLAKNFGLPESTFDGFPKKEVYFARGALPPEPAASRSQGRNLPRQTHKYRLLAESRIVYNKGGRRGWSTPQVPDLQDDHGRDPRPRPRGAAGAALAPDGRRVAVRHRGEGQRDDVRLARPLPDRDPGEGRRRLHPARVRPLDRERRRQAVPGPHRVQHRGLRGRSTCRNGLPGTRSTCWPPTSASRRPCSRSSHARTCSSRTRRDPRSPCETALRRNDERGPGRPTPPHPRLMVPPAGMRSQRQNCAVLDSSAPSHPSGVASAGPTLA